IRQIAPGRAVGVSAWAFPDGCPLKDLSACQNLFHFGTCLHYSISPQGSPQNRPTVVTSKPANGKWPGTRLFYSDASCGGKSVFVRQLRGPHLSTWLWWRRRSSIAVTAALSPSSLPQSSTGRFNAESIFLRTPRFAEPIARSLRVHFTSH